jgi:hypothetical protein
VAFRGKPMWNFLGNWFVETYIHGSAQATEQNFWNSVSFAVLSYLRKFKEYKGI